MSPMQDRPLVQNSGFISELSTEMYLCMQFGKSDHCLKLPPLLFIYSRESDFTWLIRPTTPDWLAVYVLKLQLWGSGSSGSNFYLALSRYSIGDRCYAFLIIIFNHLLPPRARSRWAKRFCGRRQLGETPGSLTSSSLPKISTGNRDLWEKTLEASADLHII